MCVCVCVCVCLCVKQLLVREQLLVSKQIAHANAEFEKMEPQQLAHKVPLSSSLPPSLPLSDFSLFLFSLSFSPFLSLSLSLSPSLALSFSFFPGNGGWIE